MVNSSQAGGSRVTSTLDALLTLSRALAGTKQGGMLADALEMLLTAIGCSRGAAYTAVGDALELVAERQLPAALRPPLARLSLTGTSWFAAQKAAQTRKLVADRDLGASEGCPLDRAALALSRWGQVVACPIVSGRDVYGVLVFAWPADEEPYYLGLAVVEIACNMMAMQMARLRDEQQQKETHAEGVRAGRMVTLGFLAGGFAEELDAHLTQVGLRFAEQQRRLDALLARLPAREAGAPAANTAVTLRPVREATSRFLSAIQKDSPGPVELGALAADVLALAAPHLRRRRIDVRLAVSGEHFVVGRRSELIQLFSQIVLGVAGALDDSDEILSDRGALIPRTFALEVCRQAGHEVLSLSDGGEEDGGARSSFFDLEARPGDAGFDLGLVREIVSAHEGHIEIGRIGVAGGTQCKVVLPAAASEAERRAARLRLAPVHARSSAFDGARPVLLWIDADDLLLEIMTQQLHEMDVRVVRNAAEATQFLAFGATPDLVLCNVRLPDRPGHALHAEVARQTPRLAQRFVFVSDGVLTPEIASYLIASGRPTLVRPIDVEQVRALALRDQAVLGHAVMAPTLAGPGPREGARRAPTVPAVLAIRPPPADDDRATMLPVSPGASIKQPPPGPALPSYPPRSVPITMRPAAPYAPHDGGAAERPAKSPAPPAPAVPAPTMGAPPPNPAPSVRDQMLDGIARAIAESLRREGPKRGAVISEMLRQRGLSEPEALSVMTFALSNGILVRDAPPSALIRARDADVRKSVLVVDDDFDLRQTLRDVLEDEGYVVDMAANGREALDLLRRSNPPRVMVLDLMMPVMDGWQLLDELRRDDSLADIPVVVISASKTGLHTPGALEVLSKPLDYYKLVTTLERSMKPRTALQ